MRGKEGSSAAPLASRSHPPALKSGTFYFAEMRNFLFCVDIWRHLAITGDSGDYWIWRLLDLAITGSVMLFRKLTVRGTDSVISASPAHSSHTLQYLIGRCAFCQLDLESHVPRMQREQATPLALMVRA